MTTLAGPRRDDSADTGTGQMSRAPLSSDSDSAFAGEGDSVQLVAPRIAIMTEFLPGDVGAVAFARRLEAVADFLKSKGAAVALVAPDRTENNAQPSPDGRDVQLIRGYASWRKLLKSPVATLFFPLFILRGIRGLRRCKADVTIIAVISPILLLESLLSAKLVGSHTVIDVCDSWLILSAFRHGRVRNRLGQLLEGIALRRADLVVAVTRTQLEMLVREYRLNSKKTTWTPNGTISALDLQSPLGKVYDLVHAGPPRGYYDTPALFDAVEILRRRLHALRVGFFGMEEGPERNRWNLEIRQRNLESTVELLRSYSRSELRQELAKAKAGVVSLSNHPAYKATISTKSLDYIEAGLPVIYLGPLDSEQANLIIRYGIGVAADNAKVFAKIAERLLTDEGALEGYRAKCREASRQLDWNRVLQPLYQRIMDLYALD